MRKDQPKSSYIYENKLVDEVNVNTGLQHINSPSQDKIFDFSNLKVMIFAKSFTKMTEHAP